MTDDQAAASNQDWRRQFRRGLVFIRPDAGVAVVVLVLAVFLALLSAVEPLLLRMIFDSFGSGDVVHTLFLGVVGLLVLGVAREGFGALSNWLNWRVRLRVHQRMLDATVERLHSLPLSYHRQQTVGGIMTRLDRGIQGFIGALTEFTFNILPAALYLLFALVIMFSLDWRLTLVVLVFAPIPALIGAWAAREQTERDAGLLKRWSDIYSRFNEVLSGIVMVKSFSMEDAEKRRFMTGVTDANQVVVRGVRRDSTVGAVRNVAANLARIAVIAFGGYLVIQGQVTLGTLVAFLGYIGGLFGPVQGLTGSYATIRRAAVSLEAVFSILDAQDRLGDAPDAVDLGPVRGEVEFREVWFEYPERRSGDAILGGVSLRVRPGEHVALVGPSGAGKSTLMSLLQRLYDPSAGAVLVDGQDVRRVKQGSLRRQIGVVLQDPVLLNDTVRHVIAYARPEATDEEVVAAAKAANAHNFIMRMPDGYDSMVGERGSRLSTGERQRLTIARALLKDPGIVILDEATSALDAETEAAVQEAVDRLIAGRTTFVVAHRLSTIVGADRIIVLKDGRIMEQGAHRELMGRDGYYAMLVRHQTRGLLPDVEPADRRGGAVASPRAPDQRRETKG